MQVETAREAVEAVVAGAEHEREIGAGVGRAAGAIERGQRDRFDGVGGGGAGEGDE
ncbi:hypothetical protein D3C83_218340 [compost metagenome]